MSHVGNIGNNDRQECARKIWEAYAECDHSEEIKIGYVQPITGELAEKLKERLLMASEMKRYGFLTQDGCCLNLERVIAAKGGPQLRT